jgi:hypothetical protein
MANQKLLFDKSPLVINTELAVKIGLNESVILQQIHYWLEINRESGKNFHDGYYWTFNSYEDWQKQFPFWSVRTIRRTISNLESLNLLVSANYNTFKIDRTKWYRINYEALEMPDISHVANLDTSIGQNGQTNGPTCPNEEANLDKPLPEITTENTPENNIHSRLFDFWNQQGIIRHEKLTPEMKKAIAKILKVLTLEQVMVCITRYKQIIEDEGFFFSYRWNLADFLNRKNGIKDFLDDGAKWVSYQAHLKAQKQAKPPEKDPDRFRDPIPECLERMPIISKEGVIIGWRTEGGEIIE